MNLETYLNQPFEFEPEMMRYFNKKEALVIFEIGACEGEDSIKLRRKFPKAEIYAFEPMPKNIKRMKENYKKYGTDIKISEVALSSSNGTAEFFVSSGRPESAPKNQKWDYGNKSSSLLAPKETKKVWPWLNFKDKIKVSTQRLDNFCLKNSVEKIDFAFIDVQGAELMVLEGAGDYLGKIGMIWLEVEAVELYAKQPLKNDIERFMKKNGFVLIKNTVNGITGDQLYINRRLAIRKPLLTVFLSLKAHKPSGLTWEGSFSQLAKVKKIVRILGPVFRFLNPRLGLTVRLQRKMKANPKIGMALLIQDRPEYLKHSLESLLKTKVDKYNLTILLYDDGSADKKTIDLVNSAASKTIKIQKYRNDKPSGTWGGAFNGAMQKLMELEDFDIVGSADSDCYFHPDWLTKTMDVAIYAKAHYKKHILGPFSSFNSSDHEFHKILAVGHTPYGNFVVKERMGALNYFYYKKDFLKLGYFEANKDDETIMTEKFKRLRVRNFSLEQSYVEHIGMESILNKTRPTPVKHAVYAMNLVKKGWSLHPSKIRDAHK